MRDFLTFQRRLDQLKWFVDFCDERIKSITDYALDETKLDATSVELLKIYRLHKNDMEDRIAAYRFTYFCGLFS